MKVERIAYHGWPEAYRCSAGPLELIVVSSMGPRILSLRFEGGQNLLYEDASGFKIGTWQLAGGHRFTTAPESDASYIPDNQPCEVLIERDGLVIHQRLDDGLLRGLQIRPEMHGPGFALRQVLRNVGREPWDGAAWSITCVPASGRVIVPQTQGPARFWQQPGACYASSSSPQWQNVDDCAVVEPLGQKGKIGLRGQQGWLAWLGPDSTFVIRGPVWSQQSSYPDGGCNIEVYTCASYLELETLGPLTTLRPGQELAHLERWQLVPRAFSPPAWRHIDRLDRSRRARRPAAEAPA